MLSRLTLLVFVSLPILIYVNFGDIPLFTGYAFIAVLTVSLFFALLIKHPQYIKTTLVIPTMIPLLILISLPGVLLNEVMSISFLTARYLHLLNFAFFFMLVRSFVYMWRLDKVFYYMMLFSFVSPAIAVMQSISFNNLRTDVVINLFRDNARILYGANAAEFFQDGAYYSWLASTTFIKAPGIFTTPVENAFYSVMILCLALALYISKVPSPYLNSQFLLTVSACQILNIVLSATRSIWLSTGFVLIVLLGRHLLRSIWRVLAISIIGVASVSGFSIIVGVETFYSFLSNTVNLQDASSVGRIASLNTGINLFLNYPLFGVGLGNADLHSSTNIHSMAVTFLAELGVLGLMFLMVFFSTMFRNSAILAQSPIAIHSALGKAIFVIICAYLINSTLFANNFFHPKIALLLWGFYAVNIALLKSGQLTNKRTVSVETSGSSTLSVDPYRVEQI